MEEILDVIPRRFIHNENAFIVTNSRGQILWVNPALSILCGYDLTEIKGRKPGAILQGPNTDPQLVEEMRHAIKAGIGCIVQITNYHKDGHSYPVHIEIMPVEDKRGKVRLFAAIERQFTDRELKEIGHDTLQLALHRILEDFVKSLKQQL